MNENKIKAKASVTYFPLFILFFYTLQFWEEYIYIYFFKRTKRVSIFRGSTILHSFLFAIRMGFIHDP